MNQARYYEHITMKYFKIVFDNASESFFAGQAVSGKVHLHLNSPKKLKALKIKLVGKGEAHWIEKKQKATFFHDTEEYYVNFESSLIEEQPGTEDTTLPPGNHEYDFSFQLPTGIPSSFQGSKGKIQYYALVTLTRSWKFSQKTSSYFTVNGLMDLNTHLTASNPIGLNQTKILPLLGCLGSMWCCTNASVGFVFSVDKTGFVPGEIIKFNLNAFNQSAVRVKSMHVKIIQVVTFHILKDKRRETHVILDYVYSPGLDPGESVNWISSSESATCLRVPAVPPTNLGGGKVITVDYKLEISLKVSTCVECEAKAQFPVIIGTIPFRSTFEQLRPASRFNQNQSNPTAAPLSRMSPAATGDGHPSYGTLAIPLSLESYPDLPPPTYNEAMVHFDIYGSNPRAAKMISYDEVDTHDEKDDKSEAGETEDDEAGSGRPFTPRYATYGWGLGS